MHFKFKIIDIIQYFPCIYKFLIVQAVAAFYFEPCSCSWITTDQQAIELLLEGTVGLSQSILTCACATNSAPAQLGFDEIASQKIIIPY